MKNQPNESPEELRQSRLTAYALDMLDKHQRDALELELADDADARQSLDEIDELSDALRADAIVDDPLPPSSELPAAIEQRLTELEAEQKAAVKQSPSRKQSRRRWLALAVAVALLIAAVPLGYSWFVGDEESVANNMMPGKSAPRNSSVKVLFDTSSSTSGQGRVTFETLRERTTDEKKRISDLTTKLDPQARLGKIVTGERLGVPSQNSGGPSPTYQSNDIYYYAPGKQSTVAGQAPSRTDRWGYLGKKYNGRQELDELLPLEFDRGQSKTGLVEALGSAKATFWFKEIQAKPVATSPDGRYLLASAANGSVHLWDVNADRPVDLPPGVLPPMPALVDGTGGERYEPIVENHFLPTRGETARSTFSIDVDTASYSNVRRFLNSGSLPPVDAVRIEELVNYFRYDYPQPKKDEPFSVSMEVAACPWKPDHKLLRIGLKGREIEKNKRPATNLVFLLDVSGSMNSPDKLPLLKEAMKFLVAELNGNDTVTIVTYRGNAGLTLDDANGDEKIRIRNAIDRLSPGGSTHGSQGIELAYEKAVAGFIKGGANRVILATDGDLNVGITEDEALVKLIKEKAETGVFLTVLGFGTGNLKDSKMEKLADNGNGMYAYIDNLREARKVLVEQIGGSLITIAKDVKIQLEFNPAEVAAYRLIGYENRLLANKDFDDDTKDAGEIGAGHTVTALYELVPPQAAKKYEKKEENEEAEQSDGDGGEPAKPLKYQRPAKQQATEGLLTEAAKSGDLVTLALRFKKPDGKKSKRIEYTVKRSGKAFNKSSKEFQFASAVASFGMLLRNSRYKGAATLSAVEEIAASAKGKDPNGYRKEFLELVRKAQVLKP